MKLLSAQYYQSDFLVGNKEDEKQFINKLRDDGQAKKGFIKTCNNQETQKDICKSTTELQTIDTDCVSSPINELCRDLNKEIFKNLATVYDSNMNKETPVGFGEFPSEARYNSFPMPNYNNWTSAKDRLPNLRINESTNNINKNIDKYIDEYSSDESDTACTPMAISLPFLKEFKYKSSSDKTIAKPNQRRNKQSPVFRIQKIKLNYAMHEI